MKEEVEKKEEEKAKILSPNDMVSLERDISTIEHYNSLVKEVNKDLENTVLRVRIAKQEIELLEIKRRQLGSTLKGHTDMLKLKKEQHQKYLKMLATKYRIKNSNWGFNPETGEIS